MGFLADGFSFQQYLSYRLQIGGLDEVNNKCAHVFAVTANNKRLTLIEHLLYALTVCNIIEACLHYLIESMHQVQELNAVPYPRGNRLRADKGLPC